ncbi:serine acetyltransferase [Paenibacillus sp. FSL E2-8871]|uniref:serine O-acetyltransferase n=1 Tax=Paenibacillus sp. FSL E2-8871 TaxID=2975326 RepID=UPI0030FC5DB2
MRKSEFFVQKAIKAYNKGKIRIAVLYCYVLRIMFSFDFIYTASVDPSVQFIHNGLGCVIHPKAKVGPNCKIYQNVTLGGNGKIINGKLENQGGPILEEGVVVFAGACILGPVVVGKGAVIGANAVVLNDVPPNTLAVGVPAVIKPLKSNYNFLQA